MKRFILLTTLLGLFSISAMAQGTRLVKGYVQDANTQALQGAVVRGVSENNSTKAGADGTFELEVSTHCKYVEASFEGYITAQAEIDGSIIIFRLNIDKKYASNKAKAEKAARIAAEKEAARIAAEQEVARLTAEREAARIAAEQEAARLAAEKEATEKAKAMEYAKQEAARIAAEQEAAAKAKADEEARAIAEKAKEEEAARLAAEKAKADEAARIAAEKEKAEKAALVATEKAKVAENALLAAKEKIALLTAANAKAEETAHIATKQAKAAETARLAAEKEIERLKVEKAQAEENARLALEGAKAAHAAQLAAEQKLAALQKEMETKHKVGSSVTTVVAAQSSSTNTTPQGDNAVVINTSENKKELKKNRFGQMLELGYLSTSQSVKDINRIDQALTLYYTIGGNFNNTVFFGVGSGVIWNLGRNTQVDKVDESVQGGTIKPYSYDSETPCAWPLGEFAIPLYLNLKVNLARNAKVAPYLSFMGGTEISAVKDFYYTSGYQEHRINQTTIFGRASLGINFRLNDKSAMHLGIGYHIDRRLGYDNESVHTRHYTVHGFAANLGFTF